MSETHPKIGHRIQGDAFRDAIHIAIAPVEATHMLQPGDHVTLVDGDVTKIEKLKIGKKAIGIVDPFIIGPVLKGEKCYLFLYPQTITALRHQWTHPAFPEGVAQPVTPETEKDRAIVILTEFASRCGVSYERFISAVEYDDYISMGENEHYKGVYDEYPEGEIARLASIVLGKEIKYAYPFSCSC